MAELSAEVPALMSALQVSSKQSFELGFNKACALLDLGEFSAAETELRMALKTGREALFEEDCSEEEVAEELAPLTVQLGYALGQQGKSIEALEIYEQVGAGKQVHRSSTEKLGDSILALIFFQLKSIPYVPGPL